MARVLRNFSLEPEVSEELTEFAGKLGMNVSAVVNSILKSVFSGDPSEIVSMMFSNVLRDGQVTDKELMEEVEKEVNDISNRFANSE